MNQNSNVNGRPSSADDGKKNVVDEAKQVATHATEKAREQATQKLGSQKDRAVETIGGVADAIRTAGDSMKGGPLPDMAERAADQIESVANYFKSRTVGDIVGEVERFARREPAIFLGASFALGLLGGRFLKSSAHKAQASTDFSSGGSQGYGGRYGADYSSRDFGQRDFGQRDFGGQRDYGYQSPPARPVSTETRLGTATPTPMAKPATTPMTSSAASTTKPVTTTPITSVGGTSPTAGSSTTGKTPNGGNRGGM